MKEFSEGNKGNSEEKKKKRANRHGQASLSNIQGEKYSDLLVKRE